MNATQIRREVLLGSHANAKAFVQTEIIARVGGYYDGSGGVFVDTETSGEAYAWANAAQATLGPAFIVTKPWGLYDTSGHPAGYRFQIRVRS